MEWTEIEWDMGTPPADLVMVKYFSGTDSSLRHGPVYGFVYACDNSRKTVCLSFGNNSDFSMTASFGHLECINTIWDLMSFLDRMIPHYISTCHIQKATELALV